MRQYLLNPLRAVLVSLLLFINMLFISSSILIIFGLIFLLPKQKWRHKGREWLQFWPVWWMDVNYWILQISTFGKWRIRGDQAPLSDKNWYLLISNHQSWIDILVLGTFFRHKIPILKFFMKKELLWSLPIAGWACYVLDYPFMARHSHEEVRKNPQLKMKDIETTHRACDKFKEYPTTVMNFVEGTRFTQAKRGAQQSPYQNLLKPKAMGVGLVLNELHPFLSGIVNVTLQYHPQTLTLWQFLSGQVQQIYLHYELLPVSAELTGDPYTDRIFRKHLQQWLNDLWQAKDQHLKNYSCE